MGIPQLISSTEFAGTYISTLNCVGLRQLFEIWVTPQINLFTSAANHRLPRAHWATTRQRFTTMHSASHGQGGSHIPFLPLPAISSTHTPVDDCSSGSHPAVSQWVKGLSQSKWISRSVVSVWDLDIVLSALKSHPFERPSHDKFTTWKTVCLVAVTSA